MKILLVLLLIPCLGFSKIIVKDGYVQPFEKRNYSFHEIISDFANPLGKMILTENNLSEYSTDLIITKKIKVDDLEPLLDNILRARGFTIVDEGSFLRVINARDIRYSPTKLYDSSDFPTTDKYIFVYHVLKAPLAHSASRNMRPFMSRWGRIIDFNDGHSLVVNDRGRNIKNILKFLNAMDTEEAYAELLKGNRGDPVIKKKKSKEELEYEILELQKIQLEANINLSPGTLDLVRNNEVPLSIATELQKGEK